MEYLLIVVNLGTHIKKLEPTIIPSFLALTPKKIGNIQIAEREPLPHIGPPYTHNEKKRKHPPP